VNFGVGLEEVGGLSTKDVSVVLYRFVSLEILEFSSRSIHESSLSIKIVAVISL
jgi:hypothetical protein